MSSGKPSRKKKGSPLPAVNAETLYTAIIDRALKAEKMISYKRSKLMVLGEAKSGKTSTIKSLLNHEFDAKQISADETVIEASDWIESNQNFLDNHPKPVQAAEENSKEEEKTEKSRAKGKMSKRKKFAKDEVKQFARDVVMGNTDDMVSFSIWDFGGQTVFYSLNHLFLKEYGCYLLIFDITSILDDNRRADSLEYLRFWLFSKKLHAPLSPIILVGTHVDLVSRDEIMEVNEIISTEVLGTNKFGEVHLNSTCFVYTDNENGRNIALLRAKIEEVVRKELYINDQVPAVYLKLLEMLLNTNKKCVPRVEVDEIMERCDIAPELHQPALLFLAQRGLITYFSSHDTLRKFIILHPQWLISAIAEIIFDDIEETHPTFDSEFGRDFRKFTKERVISIGLLNDMWQKKGYTIKAQKYLRRIMLKTSLMCNYSFDKGEHYLIPSLFWGGASSIEDIAKGDDKYSGPFAVIDFSGNYDNDIVLDDGESYVRYLPFGFFERFVCLCVDLSCLHEDSIKPEIGDNYARLSLGVDVDFEVRVCNDEHGKPMWIKIKTEADTTMEAVRDLVKMGYSMIDGLRDDFFEKKEGYSKLAISLLVPSSEASGNVLAEYNMLLKHYMDDQESLRLGKSKRGKKIRPSRVNMKKIDLDCFTHWFESASESPVSSEELLTSSPEPIELEKQEAIYSVGKFKPVPGGLKYHCFLSYKQSSAIDMVGKQFYILTGKGYRCWYDQQFRGELNLEAMKKGVQKSMCYMLFLSKDIFPSAYVEEEVKMAVKMNKPIILVHHPDTGSVGYWKFADYINKAPDVLKPFFSKIESIQLQRRHYLEEAVTHVIDGRLQNISAELYKNSSATP